MPRLLLSFSNGHRNVLTGRPAGAVAFTAASPAKPFTSLSGACSLSAMLTAVTHLSGREGIRMHIPNKPSGSQAAHVAWRPSFFPGRPVLQFRAGVAAGGVSVADRDRRALQLLKPVTVTATLPFPSPNTSHTTLACSPALTSLVMLLLLRRRRRRRLRRCSRLLLGGTGGGR